MSMSMSMPLPLLSTHVLRHTAGALVLLATLASAAQAAPPSAHQAWMTVGDQTLESLRGGFSMGEGLTVSFGITRAVLVNGALITETTLNVGHMADLTTAQAAQLGQKLESISLVQNGPGNSFAPDPSTGRASIRSSPTGGPTVTSIAGGMAGTVIQNSLNNQQISHQTTINANSNGLGMVRALNLPPGCPGSLGRGAGRPYGDFVDPRTSLTPQQRLAVIDLAASAERNDATPPLNEEATLALARDDARQHEDWWEPEGLILATQGASLLGFHWTKRHDADTGEVYVLGVSPQEAGRGLGKVLLQAGLARLARGGATRVILYVDAGNDAAVALYRKAGFQVEHTDTLFGTAPAS